MFGMRATKKAFLFFYSSVLTTVAVGSSDWYVDPIPLVETEEDPLKGLDDIQCLSYTVNNLRKTAEELINNREGNYAESFYSLDIIPAYLESQRLIEVWSHNYLKVLDRVSKLEGTTVNALLETPIPDLTFAAHAHWKSYHDLDTIFKNESWWGRLVGTTGIKRARIYYDKSFHEWRLSECYTAEKQILEIVDLLQKEGFLTGHHLALQGSQGHKPRVLFQNDTTTLLGISHGTFDAFPQKTTAPFNPDSDGQLPQGGNGSGTLEPYRDRP